MSVFTFREKFHALGNFSAISFGNLKTLFVEGLQRWEALLEWLDQHRHSRKAAATPCATEPSSIAESSVLLLNRWRLPAAPLPRMPTDSHLEPLTPTACGLLVASPIRCRVACDYLDLSCQAAHQVLPVTRLPPRSLWMPAWKLWEPRGNTTQASAPLNLYYVLLGPDVNLRRG
jgi:hypothetical protein